MCDKTAASLARRRVFYRIGLLELHPAVCYDFAKTVTTLTHVDALATVEGDRTLVIAPRRVAVGTWPEEAAKWGFDRVQPITGTAAERAEAIKVPALAHTINPENIPWLVEHCGDVMQAEHHIMDCLAEMIWQSQRSGTAYDAVAYLACLDRKMGAGE